MELLDVSPLWTQYGAHKGKAKGGIEWGNFWLLLPGQSHSGRRRRKRNHHRQQWGDLLQKSLGTAGLRQIFQENSCWFEHSSPQPQQTDPEQVILISNTLKTREKVKCSSSRLLRDRPSTFPWDRNVIPLKISSQPSLTQGCAFPWVSQQCYWRGRRLLGPGTPNHLWCTLWALLSAPSPPAPLGLLCEQPLPKHCCKCFRRYTHNILFEQCLHFTLHITKKKKLKI